MPANVVLWHATFMTPLQRGFTDRKKKKVLVYESFFFFTWCDVKEIPFCLWRRSHPDLDITADSRLNGDDSLMADGIKLP